METIQIAEWVEQFLANKSEGYYLVEVNWNKKSQKLEVYLDKDDGITLGDCQRLSREMQEILELENQLSENYVLDVSSPGVDRPLKLKRQYIKNLGRIVQVELKDDLKILGRLEKIEDAGVIIRPEQAGIKGRKTIYGDEKMIVWEDIKQTIVQIRF